MDVAERSKASEALDVAVTGSIPATDKPQKQTKTIVGTTVKRPLKTISEPTLEVDRVGGFLVPMLISTALHFFFGHNSENMHFWTYVGKEIVNKQLKIVNKQLKIKNKLTPSKHISALPI